MKTSLKAAFSLLITVVLFAVVYLLFFSGFFEPGLLIAGFIEFTETSLYPRATKAILLASLFLTVFLVTFLLFNLKQDSVTIVQDRMKRLLISLIEQFYEHKIELDWARWGQELRLRRNEINAQLMKGIKPSQESKDIDVMINKSWDEMFFVMDKHGKKAAEFEAELEELEVVDEDYEPEPSPVDESLEYENMLEDLKKLELPEDEIVEHGKVPASYSDSLQQLASKIEFGAGEESENDDPGLLLGNLEIATPFTKDPGPDDGEVSNVEEIFDPDDVYPFNPGKKQGPNSGLFLTGRQYFTITGKATIEDLEVVSAEEDEPELAEEVDGNPEVIEEREGVHYISRAVLNPRGGTAGLNSEFKTLVDSVLKP